MHLLSDSHGSISSTEDLTIRKLALVRFNRHIKSLFIYTKMLNMTEVFNAELISWKNLWSFHRTKYFLTTTSIWPPYNLSIESKSVGFFCVKIDVQTELDESNYWHGQCAYTISTLMNGQSIPAQIELLNCLSISLLLAAKYNNCL